MTLTFDYLTSNLLSRSVIRGPSHVAIKFEVCIAFPFQVHGTDRQTDGQTGGIQRLVRPTIGRATYLQASSLKAGNLGRRRLT